MQTVATAMTPQPPAAPAADPIALKLLRDGKPTRGMERKPEEERNFRMLGLLTSKPVLYVCNVEEGSAATGNSFSQAVFDHAKKEGAVAVVISAKIEAEIAILQPVAPGMI